MEWRDKAETGKSSIIPAFNILLFFIRQGGNERWLNPQQVMYQHAPQQRQGYPTTPGDQGFAYQVSENLRSEMMNELLQIQAYVNEMDEVITVPQMADQTTLILSQTAKDGNLELAKQKEREYLKKAQEALKQEMSQAQLQ